MKQTVKNTNFLLLFFIFISPNLEANKTTHIDTIYLGSGCFWGAEKVMSHLMVL